MQKNLRNIDKQNMKLKRAGNFDNNELTEYIKIFFRIYGLLTIQELKINVNSITFRIIKI